MKIFEIMLKKGLYLMEYDPFFEHSCSIKLCLERNDG